MWLLHAFAGESKAGGRKRAVGLRFELESSLQVPPSASRYDGHAAELFGKPASIVYDC